MVTVPRLQRYYRGATTSCPRMAFGLLIRQPAPRTPVGVCVRREALPSPYRPGGGPGSGLFTAGCSHSSGLAHGQEQDLPGSLATHPVTLRRSTTPDDPVAPRRWRRFRCCPRPLNTEGVVALTISRLTPPLHHLLSTLHDGRCRTPCKTRFRLAGCAFAGRESNPLDRYERFQLMSSSSPGLRLAR